MHRWVGVVGLLVVNLLGCRTTPLPPAQFSKSGCTVVVNEVTHSAFYEPIRIVGEREGVDEDGNPLQEWWVWFPARPRDEQLDKHGVVRAANVKKSKVLFDREFRMIKGVMCKCPGD